MSNRTWSGLTDLMVVSGVALAPAHDVARRDKHAIDPAVDRRRNLGEGKVETRGGDGRVADLNLCAGGVPLRHGVVIGFARDRAGRDELFRAAEIAFRECGRGLRLAKLRLRLIEHDLEGARINAEQKLPLPDDRTFRDVDGDDRAADARPQLDALGRGQ